MIDRAQNQIYGQRIHLLDNGAGVICFLIVVTGQIAGRNLPARQKKIRIRKIRHGRDRRAGPKPFDFQTFDYPLLA